SFAPVVSGSFAACRPTATVRRTKGISTMRIRSSLSALLAAVLLAGVANAAHAQAREQGRLLIASEVLEEIRNSRDQSIPERLLQRAYAIAVIPDLTKVAFFAGGRRGHGVLVVRDKQGRFSNPVLITLTGGSFGWQWGVQSTDIVLVFTTAKGVEGITGGKVTLGADASVAAGPVGRQAEAATDATFRSEVYSYSRSRGVFAGIAPEAAAPGGFGDATSLRRNSRRSSARLVRACSVTEATDRYHTCMSVKCGSVDKSTAGSTKVSRRAPELASDGQVLPSAWNI